MTYGLANKPLVFVVFGDFAPRNGQAQLKRHVKPRGARPRSIQLYSRKIVNRMLAGLDQVKDFIEPIGTLANFKRGSRRQAESSRAADVGQEEFFKFFVVRDIQKNFNQRALSLLHA